MSLIIPGFSVAFGLGSSSATVYPTFLDALVAYWKSTDELVAVSKAPYADVGPLVVPEDKSFCVLSQVSSTATEWGTRKRAYREDSFYQFAVYHRDQHTAILKGEEMVAKLDQIQDQPLLFEYGYQRAWFRQGGRLIAIPEVGKTGARTVWQQTHTYKLTIGRSRGS